MFYDPMLAKVISCAPDPAAGRARILADALARTRLHGIRTNRDLLVNVLRHPAFLAGDTDTAFFDTHGLAELAAPLADPAARALAALAAALADAARQPQQRNGVRRRCPAAGATCRRATRPRRYVDAAGDEHDVGYRFTRGRLRPAGRRRT